MARRPFLTIARFKFVNGKASRLTAKKAPSFKAASSLSLKADSSSLWAWMHSCLPPKSTSILRRTSMSSLAKLSISKLSRLTKRRKISLSLVASSSKSNAVKAVVNFLKKLSLAPSVAASSRTSPITVHSWISMVSMVSYTSPT